MKEDSSNYQKNSGSKNVKVLRPATKQVSNPNLVYDYSNNIYLSRYNQNLRSANSNNNNIISSVNQEEPKRTSPMNLRAVPKNSSNERTFQRVENPINSTTIENSSYSNRQINQFNRVPSRNYSRIQENIPQRDQINMSAHDEFIDRNSSLSPINSNINMIANRFTYTSPISSGFSSPELSSIGNKCGPKALFERSQTLNTNRTENSIIKKRSEPNIFRLNPRTSRKSRSIKKKRRCLC